MKKIISKLFSAAVLSLLAVSPVFAANTEGWNLTGTYTIEAMAQEADPTAAGHTGTLVIDQTDETTGDFSGNASLDMGQSQTMDAAVTGNVSGNDLEFEATHTDSATGAVHTITGTGFIEQDGSMSGTATGLDRQFAWETTSGNATHFEDENGGGNEDILALIQLIREEINRLIMLIQSMAGL